MNSWYLQSQQFSTYNIANVKSRYIPTYDHTHIFQRVSPTVHKIRVTPTYASSIFGGNWVDKRSQSRGKKQSKPNRNKTISPNRQRSNSKESRCVYTNRGWMDSAKADWFEQIETGTSYSRQRKLVDLSSNPVFGWHREYKEAQPQRQQANPQIQVEYREQEPPKQLIKNDSLDQLHPKRHEPVKNVPEHIQIQIEQKNKQNLIKIQTKFQRVKKSTKKRNYQQTTKPKAKPKSTYHMTLPGKPSFVVIRSRPN